LSEADFDILAIRKLLERHMDKEVLATPPRRLDKQIVSGNFLAQRI
jgi:hypothetical protein